MESEQLIQNADKNAPGLFVHQPERSKFRLIIPFVSMYCCGISPGLIGESRLIPQEIKQAGISVEQWNKYLNILETQVQPAQSCVCTHILCWSFLICIPYFIFSKQKKYNTLLSDWLHDFNTNVLEPHNMYAKIQTNEIHAHYYHECHSWLAIALNIEESKKLKNEPVCWKPECCSISKMQPSCCQKICCCGCGPYRAV